MGPRRVGAHRGSGGGARQGKAALRAARLQAARRLDAREDQEVGEGLAPDKGAGCLYLEERGHVSPRFGAVGANGRGAARRQQESGEARGRVEEAQGARARRPRGGRRSHARRNARGAVLACRVGLRGEARRLSHARGQGRRDGSADHPQRQRLLRGLPGADSSDRRTAVLEPAHGRGAGDPGRARAAELSTPPEPGAHRPGPGDPACVRRDTWHPLSLRPDGGGGVRPAVPAAPEAQGAPAESAAGGGTAALLGAFREDGEALYDRAVGMGLEGIVAKKADAPYKSGRSDLWQKIRADKTGDFVVVGYTAPKGSRGGFGALHLGGYADGKLVYAGRAGSGFSGQTLKDVGDQLLALETPRPPFEGPVPAEKESHWVKPELVAEVRYKEVTGDGLLRQPVFLRFRDDKKPEECVLPAGGTRDEGGREEPAPAAARLSSPFPPPAVQFPNLGQVFWPEEGYTTGDLIEYYRAFSPWMLPYLTGRPLVLTRCPGGINGKSFFQKDAPEYAQAFVRTITIWSEDSQRELDYFVCDNESSLLYI